MGIIVQGLRKVIKVSIIEVSIHYIFIYIETIFILKHLYSNT